MEKIQGLLEWAQRHTTGYGGVSVKDFTSSWKDGLAFSALIHRFKPELINFHQLDPVNEYYNNYMAFKLAETHFGIPQLLDPKDMFSMPCPERLSIITYVSQFYNCLKNMEPNGGPNINKFENSNYDNVDFQSISCRSSIHKLTEMKCSICRNKVYLLERYVAEDKLYHRQCYRDFQIKNFDNDSEVIGDYLNIYGELKPTMNKNIFVHPLQGLTTESVTKQIITNPPVNMPANILQERYITDEEDYSESLSSFSSKDSEICDDKSVDSIEDDIFYNKSISSLPDNNQKNIDVSVREQDNLVVNIVETIPIKPLKTRLYIKKKDRELPYSTFFEMSDSINYKTCLHFNDFEDEISVEKENEEEDFYEYKPEVDEKKSFHEEISFPSDERKLIEIKLEDDNESDVSSIEEERQEIIQPSIVRNSIWRKPIICSTSVRKCHSASIPIDTKYKCYSEFKDRLANLNTKQSQIESKGRMIQLKLWEEDPSSPEYDQLLSTWLTLVEEKDKIFYEENALYSWLKDIKLQEMKENIECQIRLISKDSNDNEKVKDIESELIKKLIETVNKRAELVDAMNEENLKRLETIKRTQEALEKLCPSKVESRNVIAPVKQSEASKRKTFWKRKSSQI